MAFWDRLFRSVAVESVAVAVEEDALRTGKGAQDTGGVGGATTPPEPRTGKGAQDTGGVGSATTPPEPRTGKGAQDTGGVGSATTPPLEHTPAPPRKQADAERRMRVISAADAAGTPDMPADDAGLDTAGKQPAESLASFGFSAVQGVTRFGQMARQVQQPADQASGAASEAKLVATELAEPAAAKRAATGIAEPTNNPAAAKLAATEVAESQSRTAPDYSTQERAVAGGIPSADLDAPPGSLDDSTLTDAIGVATEQFSSAGEPPEMEILGDTFTTPPEAPAGTIDSSPMIDDLFGLPMVTDASTQFPSAPAVPDLVEVAPGDDMTSLIEQQVADDAAPLLSIDFMAELPITDDGFDAFTSSILGAEVNEAAADALWDDLDL